MKIIAEMYIVLEDTDKNGRVTPKSINSKKLKKPRKRRKRKTKSKNSISNDKTPNITRIESLHIKPNHFKAPQANSRTNKNKTTNETKTETENENQILNSISNGNIDSLEKLTLDLINDLNITDPTLISPKSIGSENGRANSDGSIYGLPPNVNRIHKSKVKSSKNHKTNIEYSYSRSKTPPPNSMYGNYNETTMSDEELEDSYSKSKSKRNKYKSHSFNTKPRSRSVHFRDENGNENENELEINTECNEECHYCQYDSAPELSKSDSERLTFKREFHRIKRLSSITSELQVIESLNNSMKIPKINTSNTSNNNIKVNTGRQRSNSTGSSTPINNYPSPIPKMKNRLEEENMRIHLQSITKYEPKFRRNKKFKRKNKIKKNKNSKNFINKTQFKEKIGKRLLKNRIIKENSIKNIEKTANRIKNTFKNKLTKNIHSKSTNDIKDKKQTSNKTQSNINTIPKLKIKQQKSKSLSPNRNITHIPSEVTINEETIKDTINETLTLNLTPTPSLNENEGIKELTNTNSSSNTSKSYEIKLKGESNTNMISETKDEINNPISDSTTTNIHLMRGQSMRWKNPFGELMKHRKQKIYNISKNKVKNWDLQSVIFKSGDDVRQEQLAMQFILLFEKIWKDAKLPLQLRPFSVVVTSPASGFVETVTNAKSISRLKYSIKNFVSLRKFFEEYFGPPGSPAFQKAQKNFVESMAAYSLVCYFLQIKDRHNGNILMDCEGRIIHIDFGFIFTNSPGGNMNFESAPFKLTEELIEVMGGEENSESFDYFQILVIRGFLEARKHSRKFILLTQIMLEGAPMPCFLDFENVVPNLEKRFVNHLNNEKCVEYIYSLIDESSCNWRTVQYDKFQRITNKIL